MDIRLVSIPFKNDEIISRRMGNEYVLVPRLSSMDDLDRIYNLDSIGADIWDRIDGIKTVGEIIADLADLYDGREEIRKNTLDFLYELADANMVKI